MLRIILILFLMISSLSATVVVQDETKAVENFKINYLIDKKATLSFEDIQKQKFENSVDSRFTFGFEKGTIWLKVDIENQTSLNQLILYFTNNPTGKYIFYDYNGTKWRESIQGSWSYKNETNIKNRNPSILFQINPGQTKTIYIKANSLVFVSELIVYPNASLKHVDKSIKVALYFFYFGGIAMAIMLSLFLFITLRDRIYGYYMGSLITLLAFVLLSSHLLKDLGLSSVEALLRASTSLAVVFYILFTIHLLNLDRYFPKITKLLKILVYIFTILAILIFIQTNPWFRIMNILSSISFILLISVATIVATYGHNKAKIYVFVVSLYFLFLGMMSMVYSGVLENNDFNFYGFLVVSFFETVIFSLLLVNRINDETHEKLLIKQQLYEEKNNYSKSLEKEVQERTEELVKVNQELEVISKTDKLTQVLNRNGIDEALRQEYDKYMRNKREFGIIILDIDLFKNINDTYGHQIGDDVLSIFAKILKKYTRVIDKVGRWGGEEFMVLCSQSDLNSIVQLAERLRFEIESYNFSTIGTMTASFGVAVIQEIDSIDSLIKRADENLYSAKEQGRNKVVFK